MILFAADVELKVYLIKVINGTQVQYFLVYRTLSPHGSHVQLKYRCFCDLQEVITYDSSLVGVFFPGGFSQFL